MIEAILTTLLKAVTPKVYPVRAPEGAVAPYCVYRRVSTLREYDLGGYAGFANPVFLVDVFGSTQLATRTLADEIVEALNDYSEGDVLYIKCENDLDLAELEPNAPRINLEFRITHRDG